MKFKEKFKEVYKNGQNWAVKHKWLCRVLVVVLALFVAFVVVSVRSCSNDKKITASADSLSITVPDNSYIITTNYNPSLYIGWTNPATITTLVFSPTLYISSSGYYVSFGQYLYQFTSNSIWCTSFFYRTSSGNSAVNPYIPDSVGFDGHIYNATFLPEVLYNYLISGDYVISRIQFDNSVYALDETSYLNSFSYDIYLTRVSDGLEVFGVEFMFNRSEMPLTSFSINSNSSDVHFSYLITYNGLSTSSAEYQSGYSAGYSSGQSSGYSSGYSDGETSGYQNGYNAGISETLSDITPWQTIVDGVNSFLNIEILPNVKLSIILSVGFGVILLGFAIKIFLGG